MCARACARVRVLVCMCVGSKLMSGIFFHHFSPYTVSQGLTHLGALPIPRVSMARLPGDALSLLSCPLKVFGFYPVP